MSNGDLKTGKRKYSDRVFYALGLFTTLIGLFVLAVLIIDVIRDGSGRLSYDFLASYPSRKPEEAGILSAWVGTVWVMVVTALVAFPLGVGAAIYLEEYARKNKVTDFIEINIANLAGVPSIIYGLLGLGVFVRALSLERSVLSGALTLALLVLPIIITASREALRAVPPSIREASYALGATKWQTVRAQVFPAALPGIMTGAILAMSRAIGETAPLVTIGALTYVSFLPESPLSITPEFPYLHISFQGVMDPFTALPIQIFNWISRPQKGFIINAAAGIVVLLVITFIMNVLAIWLRQRYRRKIRW